MGAGISHCEEQHEEPASGQQDIQSSDTATKRKPTTDMPKDAGKSASKSEDKPASKPKESKADSKPDSKPESKGSEADGKDDKKDDSKDESKDQSKNDSKDDSKTDSEGSGKGDGDGESSSNGGDSEEEAEEEPEEEPEEPKITREDVKSAPYDHRFPSFNQARHCFTRYNEYYKCTAEKGEDSDDCKFHQKAYRSICPGEWLDKWNEQRESGTWPGRY